MRVVCVLLEKNEKLKSFAESCLRLTPQVALGSRAVFLEISKCQSLYSEASLLKRLHVLLDRFRMKARVAVAEDIPTALAFCQYSIFQKEELPIEALQQYLTPFSEGTDLSDVIENFRRLGIFKIKDVLKISLRSVSPRFGKDVLEALLFVHGRKEVVWPRFQAEEKVIEHLDIDGGVGEIEGMWFFLKNLMDRVTARVRGRGEKLLSFNLVLELEKFSNVPNSKPHFYFDLAFPQVSSLELLSIVRERLNRELSAQGLSSPLIGLELRVEKSMKSEAGQKDFFSKKEEEMEAWHALVARLSEKLGMEQAFVASPVARYLPEKSWSRQKDTSEVPVYDVPRPLRLFPTPQKINKIESYFVAGTNRWEIKSVEGPERLSGEWWFDEFQRDYYRIQTQRDELWVYQIPGTLDFFLHGVFD